MGDVIYRLDPSRDGRLLRNQRVSPRDAAVGGRVIELANRGGDVRFGTRPHHSIVRAFLGKLRGMVAL